MNQIEKCRNNFAIGANDRKKLRKEQNPLERSMLRYLLVNDPEVWALKNNKRGVKIHFQIISEQYSLL